jgi:hypothetical protein
MDAGPCNAWARRAVLVGSLAMSLLAGLFNQASARAQNVAAPAGDFSVAVGSAELRETIDLDAFPDPFVPANGAYLIVWVNVANTGATTAEYDYCPPEIACVTPLWFEVVDKSGAAFPVDETVRAAFESSQPAGEIFPFGGDIPAGGTPRIVLVFDVPADAASWTLHGTDQAMVPFPLPISISQPAVVPEETPAEAGMNQVVSVGEIDLLSTRAEVRAAIDLPSFPQPFTPQGEYVVVYLTVTNRGNGDAEYDICPPGGPTCLSQLWFQLTDEAYRAYPVETIAWSAFSLKPEFLPFGSALPSGSAQPIALVFDVPAGVEKWWLDSTSDAPHPFSIQLQLSAAPGSIQVVRAATGAEAAGGSAAVELILDTSGSMLESLEGQRRIDVARDVLGQLVTETIPPGTPLALRVFGDTPDSCDTNLAAPLQPLDPSSMTGLIAGLQAIDGVKTPIGASLDRVAGDLQGAPGMKIVVLVTDGEETCGGDPAAALRAIAAQGINARVNIVGFAVEDDALKAQFRERAHLGNGQYFDATGAADLGQAIAAAVQPPFRILDAAGNEVGSGLVDGDPVEVPAGAYRVEVQAAEPITIDTVEVGSGARAVVPWDAL